MHAEPLGLRGAQVGNLCPRDIVCLRNISIKTLHKGDDDDDDDNNNDDNNNNNNNNNNMVYRRQLVLEFTWSWDVMVRGYIYSGTGLPAFLKNLTPTSSPYTSCGLKINEAGFRNRNFGKSVPEYRAQHPISFIDTATRISNIILYRSDLFVYLFMVY